MTDRRALLHAAPVMAAVAGLLVARLATAEWLAVGAALVPVVIAGAGIARRFGIRLDTTSLVPIGLLVATLLIWVVALVGYVLALPSAAVLALLAVVIGGGIVLAGLGAGSLAATAVGARRDVVAVVAVALAVATVGGLVVVLGPYYPAGFDSPFHTAALRRLLEAPTWQPPDPYFAPAALPVPQYGLGPWYPVLALLATITGRDAMATLSGSVAPLAAVAGLALAAMVRAAVERALGGSAERAPETTDAGRLAWAASMLALAAWIAWVGGLRAGLDWRLLLLPEQVGLLVFLPATLAVLWSAGPPLARRRLVLLGGLGAIAAPVHLLAAASLGAVLVGELVLGLIRRERAAWLPAIATLVGVVLGLVVTAIPLVAMVDAVGADAFGQPGYLERLLDLGPMTMLRPGVLVGSTLALAALAGAVVVLGLGPRRTGAGSLAGGALVGWLVLVLPPLSTLVAALAGAMYLTRLVTVPAALGIPLVGIAGAYLLRRPSGGTRRLLPIGVGLLVGSVVVAGMTVGLTLRGDGRATPAWVSSSGRVAAARPDDRDAIRDLAALLAPYLPSGSTVLAELPTAYVLPAVLDVRVVAVPAVHSISTDATHVNAGGRTEAGDDARLVLRRRGSIEARVAVLDRYGVTIVVLDPERSGVDAATFAADYSGRVTVVATDLGPRHLAVLAVESR